MGEDRLETSEYVIEMNHITKMVPGIIANDDITLQLKKGEIHALLGENGAGKSTLMSVLSDCISPKRVKYAKMAKSFRSMIPTTRRLFISAWFISTSN